MICDLIEPVTNLQFFRLVLEISQLYRHCTDTVHTLTDTVQTLYIHCTDTVLTLYRHCTDTLQTLYIHCTYTVLTLY